MHDAIRHTERLRLEPIGPGHAGDLLGLFRDPAVAEWYGEWTPDQVDSEVARIAHRWRTDGVHKWMAYERTTGACVGRGGLSRVSIGSGPALELGWALHRHHWGQGYATEIGRAGLAMAFEELAAGEVVSFTEVRNRRSRAVMERLGLRYREDFDRDGEPFALYVIGRDRGLPGTGDGARGRPTT